MGDPLPLTPGRFDPAWTELQGSRSPKAKEPRGRAREAGPESVVQRGVCSPFERCQARGRRVKILGEMCERFPHRPSEWAPHTKPHTTPLDRSFLPSFPPGVYPLMGSAPRQRGPWAAQPSFSAHKGVVGFRTPRFHSRVLREPVFWDPGRKATSGMASETEKGIQASWFFLPVLSLTSRNSRQ